MANGTGPHSRAFAAAVFDLWANCYPADLQSGTVFDHVPAFQLPSHPWLLLPLLMDANAAA